MWIREFEKGSVGGGRIYVMRRLQQTMSRKKKIGLGDFQFGEAVFLQHTVQNP